MFANKVALHNRAAASDPDRVHVVGTIIEMALIPAFMVLFNFFPGRIGMVQSLLDPSSFRPLLAPEFQDHMPWLNLYWGLALSLCAIKLTSRRRNLYLRSAELGLNVLAAYILLRMVLGGPLSLYPGLTLAVKFGLLVALCVSSIETIVKLVRLLARITAIAPAEQSQR